MRTITERGLRKHLEERVFVGNSEHTVDKVMLHLEPVESGRFGLLRFVDRFFVQVCSRTSLAKGTPYKRLNEVYVLRDNDVIRVGDKTDNWMNYQVTLK